MENSQASDLLFDNSMTENNTLVYSNETYGGLLSSTKKFFIAEHDLEESSFTFYFQSSLDDCCYCITQCLETICSLLDNNDVQMADIHSFMEDAISLLQMLSQFVKNLIDSFVMRCSCLKSFPTTTGKIILSVFTHCKSSELVYGIHLNSVEKQLKELFRSCHELQLVYLKILEKHFIFDVTQNEDQQILLEALDINLSIGEIVQALDVKTMAEQWKAYIAVCEKYSSFLMDKYIYSSCCEILCKLIEDNIKTALEKKDQDKMVIRSLKVTAFTIKILVKVTNIFRLGSKNNYNCLLQMLINMHMCDSAILRGLLNKSEQFIGQVNVLVYDTVLNLLYQLLHDDGFFECLMQCDIKNVREGNQLGYILLLVSTIKAILQHPENQNVILPKPKLITCVLNIVPYSEVFFKMPLKFNVKDDPYNLKQYLMSHILALCMTFNAEEFELVECTLYEAVLDTDCSKAIFSSNLWILLARVASRQYTLSVIISLSKVYGKLSTNFLFSNSPQEVHLSNTIEGLYEGLPNGDKVVLSKQIDFQSESGFKLLEIVKVKNLPLNVRASIEKSVCDKLTDGLNEFTTGKVKKMQEFKMLTDLLYVSSTSTFTELSSDLEESITRAWLNSCPKKLLELARNIDCGILWYYTFLKALISLTDVTIEKFNDIDNIVAIQNVLTNIIRTGNNELIVISYSLYCKICFNVLVEDRNIDPNPTFANTFKCFLNEKESLVKRCILSELFQYRNRRRFKNIMDSITNCDELKEILSRISNQNKLNSNEEWNTWKVLAEYNYVHKCIKNRTEDLSHKKPNANFELDIDNLFDSESDSEPASKKVKMDFSETEAIVKRLENDSALLSQSEMSEECKKRVALICDALRNIVR